MAELPSGCPHCRMSLLWVGGFYICKNTDCEAYDVEPFFDSAWGR